MRWPRILLTALVGIAPAGVAPTVNAQLPDAQLPNAQPPGAYALLERVRGAYAGPADYHDHGTLGVADGDTPARQLRFSTARDAAAGVWRLELEGDRISRTLWRDRDGVVLFNGELEQARFFDSLGGGLAVLLDDAGLGDGGLDALVVALALAGSDDALTGLDGAALAGTVPCGDGDRCWALLLSRDRATVESELWIDRETYQIRQLEITLWPSPVASRTARRKITVHHVPEAGTEPVTALAPPADARQVEAWAPEPAAAALDPGATPGATPGSQPELAFEEVVEVELFTVEVRAVDERGAALEGLGPGDFLARFAGREVPVHAVDWVSSDPDAVDPGIAAELARWGVRLEPAEKLVLIFIQTGLHRSRVAGQIRSLPHAQELLASLHPADQAAVVSFDSQLKLWLDFTRDRRALEEVLPEAIHFGGQPPLAFTRRGPRPPRPPRTPSIGARIDALDARRAASPERALELLAEALLEIPGDKVMIYLGWGLGRAGFGGVRLPRAWDGAVAALDASRTPVFVLDVTDAGFHDLEHGLRQVAAATGGTYAKMSLFPQQAARRLAQTLAGHYVLSFERRALGPHPTSGVLRIRLRQGGEILGGPFKLRLEPARRRGKDPG